MPVKIFFCYAHEDEPLLSKLKTHLRPLQRQDLIDMWHDRDISAGTEWEREINEHLSTAHIILLLVSPDFMDSEYCYGKEMKQAMERHERREACVIPVILRPVLFQDAPFGKLQALPTDAKPVKSWPDPDDAFYNVAAGVKKIAKELLVKQSLSEALNFYDTGHYTEALAVYEQAIRLDSMCADAHWGKGEALRELGKYSEALAAYERAAQAEPTIATSRFYQRKGLALIGLKRYEDALTSYQQAIDINPLNPRLYQNKAELLLERKHYEEALDIYEQIIRLIPDRVDPHIRKGDILLDLKRYEKALEAYEQAINLGPKTTLAYKGQGFALSGLKRYGEALTAYEQAIQLNLNDANVYRAKGDALYNLEHYEEALAAYGQAIQLDPTNASLLIFTGNTLAALQRYGEALKTYEQAINLDPNAAPAYMGKGHVHEKLALQAYQRAKQLGSNSEYSVTPSSPIKPEELTLLRTLTGHSGYVHSVALSADGQTLISGSRDGTIKIWGKKGGLPGHPPYRQKVDDADP